jgi:hypothetical protein
MSDRAYARGWGLRPFEPCPHGHGHRPIVTNMVVHQCDHGRQTMVRMVAASNLGRKADPGCHSPNSSLTAVNASIANVTAGCPTRVTGYGVR